MSKLPRRPEGKYTSREKSHQKKTGGGKGEGARTKMREADPISGHREGG